jgi:hypothetical protein
MQRRYETTTLKPLEEKKILADIKKMKEGRAKASQVQQGAKTPAEGLKQLAGETETEKLQRKNAVAIKKMKRQ